MNKTFRNAAETTCLNATKDVASDRTIYGATRSGVTGNVGYSGTVLAPKLITFSFQKLQCGQGFIERWKTRLSDSRRTSSVVREENA